LRGRRQCDIRDLDATRYTLNGNASANSIHELVNLKCNIFCGLMTNNNFLASAREAESLSLSPILSRTTRLLFFISGKKTSIPNNHTYDAFSIEREIFFLEKVNLEFGRRIFLSLNYGSIASSSAFWV
jgi:hypothetical protein